MKKFLKAMSAALLVVILALTMAGCDKSGSIQKAFEDAEYTVTVVDTSDSTVQSLLKAAYTEEQVEEINSYSIYLCVGKGVNALTGSGLFIKFPSSGDLKSFLTTEDSEGNKDTSAYDKAKEDGSINGNCLYVGASAGKEIFKKA